MLGLIGFGLWLGGSLGWSPGVHAQGGGLISPPPRPRPLELPPAPPPPALSPTPRRVLPPVPPADRDPVPLVRVRVQRIIVSGSSVFSPQEIAAVTRPYIGREVTSEQLETLRLALTQLYLDHGYINSGAILPDQTVTGGGIRFRIIEGELTEVVIANSRWFRDSYLRRRLRLGIDRPLHLGALQERLQLLEQDDRIARFQAQLRPGLRLGESELHVRVEEALPFTLALEFNNHQSPTVRAERGQLTVVHRNLTGYGDTLSALVEGASEQNLRLDARYSLPLNPQDTTASVQYQRNHSLVTETPFDRLDLQGHSEIFTLALRHPVYRTLQRELALTLSGEHLNSKTTFFGGAALPTPGAEDGKATITALRLTAEWTDRTLDQVIAVRSQFSLGVDLFGATINTVEDDLTTPEQDESVVPTGRFFVWLGQVQWVRRFTPHDIQLLFRVDVQVSKDPLFPLEQIALGGRFSVRGYRENQLVRDNALLMSLESRFPLIRRRRWAESLQIVPFVDFGWGQNRDVFTPSPDALASVGVGVRWAARWTAVIPVRLQFEVFWGQKLVDVSTPGGNLQDKGLHLQLGLSSF
ncbi:MAG: BamA/TamA family outer membrane protein [Candidatus Tectomicrobia bacterium]|nr:BamA/TamA family outer membrane protein [Candidatus Tectomicrobia bacterium]